ncbi:cation diffusion facilitator family transporter [Nocardioides sp. TF02-7]|uniref:cation diffusion facilitator family transporter n=1 Tax=Nocardioides sp. TF02-7 TaxID=2917724 RepID=UPI001F0665A9|nr:cation diffusion facilitator family transporter [Nocardioides sp. TF02-7]UMG92239.1 cation diffusion facilitator family transporter [Nocardioides sp. TF02-7]
MGVGHGHGHAGGRHRWRLAVAFGLVASFFGVELAVGWWSGSLALLSDAGHMAADVVALGAALAATRIATMKDRTGRKTFGSYRAEVFASGLTVLLMLGAGAYVAFEGISRIGEAVHLESGAVMVVGVIGLLINVAALLLLKGGAGESINVKGAYLEVVADTVGSVGVIAAGAMVALTGSAWWDTGIAMAIALFVIVRAVMLGREVLTVLGQHAPAGMTPAEVEAALDGLDGVEEVHDLHLWTLTSGMNVATAHLVASPSADPAAVLTSAQAALRNRYGVEHATLQIESDATACNEVSW